MPALFKKEGSGKERGRGGIKKKERRTATEKKEKGAADGDGEKRKRVGGRRRKKEFLPQRARLSGVTAKQQHNLQYDDLLRQNSSCGQYTALFYLYMLQFYLYMLQFGFPCRCFYQAAWVLRQISRDRRPYGRERRRRAFRLPAVDALAASLFSHLRFPPFPYSRRGHKPDDSRVSYP